MAAPRSTTGKSCTVPVEEKVEKDVEIRKFTEASNSIDESLQALENNLQLLEKVLKPILKCYPETKGCEKVQEDGESEFDSFIIGTRARVYNINCFVQELIERSAV